jgi:hypothetical protein
VDFEEGAVCRGGDGRDAEEEGEEDEGGVYYCGCILNQQLEDELEDVGIPVNGPWDSKMLFATLSRLCLLFSAARVIRAMMRMRMPPMTKRASKPMKAKRTAFAMAAC